MAGSVNKVILVGNLGADPEVRNLPSGGKVVNLSIATSENWKDKNTGERRDIRTILAQGHGWNKPRRSNGAQPASLYAEQDTKSFQAKCQCALMHLVVRTMVV